MLAHRQQGEDHSHSKTAGEASPAQSKAIAHAFGPMQVLAGPGSGKTYLMIRRIRHLICHHGISPDKILVITFTKAAALEMKERFQKLTQNAYSSISFGTFHAIYFHILKSGNGNRDYLPISSKEKMDYLNHSLAMCGIEEADIDTQEKLFQEISRVKNSADFGKKMALDCPKISDDSIKKYFPNIFKEYCRIMEENDKLDFDDMILLCFKMLTENSQLLSDWQNRFSHILVDEFQDISPLQYRILQKLAEPEKNLFIVGDDDQSIYGFRGAGPGIMRQFLRDYPEAQRISLDINYRCTEKIVQASSLLIEDNLDRFIKNLQAYKADGESVKLYCFDSWEEEGEYIVSELKKIPQKELAKTAIIYRVNAQSAGLSKLLTRHGIPFKVHGKPAHLLDHPIAKDFLAYLQFAKDLSDTQKGTRRDFLRIMNKPCRYIHREAAKDGAISEACLLNYYQQTPYMRQKIQRFFADLRRISSLRPYLALDYIRKTMGYDSYLCGKKEGTETWMEIADRIQETLRGAVSFDSYAERLENKESGTDKAEGVRLITMHSAKGLEYDNVFIPDVNAKTIPHSKAVSPEQVEEERRLLYVAMTRAKKRLEILCFGAPSCFLKKLKTSPYIVTRP